MENNAWGLIVLFFSLLLAVIYQWSKNKKEFKMDKKNNLAPPSAIDPGTAVVYIGYCPNFTPVIGQAKACMVIYDEHCAQCSRKPADCFGTREEKAVLPGCEYKDLKTGEIKKVRLAETVIFRTDKVVLAPNQTRYFCPKCGYERSPKIAEIQDFMGCICPGCQEFIRRFRVYRPQSFRHKVCKFFGFAWEPKEQK